MIKEILYQIIREKFIEKLGTIIHKERFSVIYSHNHATGLISPVNVIIGLIMRE